MSKANDYKHVRVWGNMMGSNHDYTFDQMQMAAEEGAPIDAIYKNQEGVWVRFADVTDENTKHYFEQRKDQLK